MGASEALGGSRVWGRDALIEQTRKTLNDPKANLTRRKRKALEGNLETLESIPNEWLDPASAPKWLNDLDAEARRILSTSTKIKREMGLISPSSAAWGGVRAQAQLMGARPLSSVRGEAYAAPRADMQMAAAIREEITFRETRGRKGTQKKRFAGYTTQALDIRAKALERRAKTIRRRVKPYIRAAEADAFSAFDEDMALRGAVNQAEVRVRQLESRPDTAQIRQEIRETRAEYNRLVSFLRDRARTRRDMADRGARFDTQNQRRRARDSETGARVAQRESLEFERDRAAARLQMATAGRRAMARAEVGRTRRDVRGARREERQAAPRVEVALGRTAAAGERKGRAQVRTSPNPDGPPTASRARALGTMLRADSGLYVARQQQGRARGVRRSEVEPAIRREGEAMASRRTMSEAEVRATRELEQARAQLRAARPRTPSTVVRTTAGQRRAQTDVARATVSTRRGVPEEALELFEGVKELQRALAATRASRNGTPGQIATARKQLNQARRNLVTARRKYERFAYVGATRPQRAGLAPGEYFPQRSTVRERRSNAISPTGGAGARMAPAAPRFNAAVLADQGDISFSPREITTALREAVDAQERAQMAAAVITRFAVRDGDRILDGDAAAKFVEANGGDGNVYTVISERQLARISSLSSDSEAGRRLMRDLEESINPQSERQFVVPTAAVKGWTDALGPASAGFRWVDSINSLWKGGVLALNPRWYLQNFFGMWGQFALGAGADLQAINMARSATYRDAIPGRISMMGLSQDFGEYARRMEGQNTNWLGALIRGGYYMNSRLEGVPRRAMFWHAAKKGLRENDFIKGGVMDEGYLARAWLDVAEAAKRGDPGANRILDDVIVETERFMGNYARYNAVEKNFLRRVFPFYGWMRSINRLAFALPVKHPKRAAILSMASLMAFEDQGLERNDTTGFQSGMFVRGRLANMNTMNPFATTMPTWQYGKELGRGVEELRPRNPLSYVGLAGRAGFGAFVAGVEQAGPLVGNAYTMVSGETPAGIPLQFSPGYQGYIRNPVGRSDRIDPTTGKEESGSPIIGPVRAAEQLLPLAGAARRLLSDNRRPYANVTSLDIARWRFGGRDPQKAPFLFQNDQRAPRPMETDLLSFLSGFFGGVSLDKVDPRAIQMREQESFKKYFGRLTSAEKRILIGQAQERQRQRRQG
jgi:hypothetical protein